MAMTMTGEIQLAAPRETVWAKLNDPDVLKAYSRLRGIGEDRRSGLSCGRQDEGRSRVRAI